MSTLLIETTRVQSASPHVDDGRTDLTQQIYSGQIMEQSQAFSSFKSPETPQVFCSLRAPLFTTVLASIVTAPSSEFR